MTFVTPFASLLIAGGASVVFVAKQMGHADASVTLKVYAQEVGGGEVGFGVAVKSPVATEKGCVPLDGSRGGGG